MITWGLELETYGLSGIILNGDYAVTVSKLWIKKGKQ
jgi:hypothetical protein